MNRLSADVAAIVPPEQDQNCSAQSDWPVRGDDIAQSVGDDAPTGLEAMMLMAEARRSHRSGLWADAEAGYRAALQLQPDLSMAHLQLVDVLLQQRRSTEAVACARRLVAADANNAHARYLLGCAHLNLGEAVAALAALFMAVECDPTLIAARINIGVILRKMGKVDEAVEHLRIAVVQNAQNAAAHLELGICYAAMNLRDAAQASFAAAARLQPMTVYPAANGNAAFSVLMIWAPGHANTPIDYLREGAPYECRMLAVSSETITAPDSIDADVVLNLLADEDQSTALLHPIAQFVDALGRPVLNHPRKIQATGRDAIAARISGVTGAVVPRTLRCSRATTASLVDDPMPRGLSYPLLIRAAGTHGGDAFERLDCSRDIAGFMATHESAEYYLTEYADYRSADGYYRKYRLIFVDGEIFPYHLAIHDHWKIHHYRTRMDETVWMQDEEGRFLSHPTSVFTPHHYAALREIIARVQLDLFGIDCAIDRDSRLVVFEVNACMLIEPDDSKYGYRLPANDAVKQAFLRMLARVARNARPGDLTP